MTKLLQRFNALRDVGRKGFIPFVTAGDPDLRTSTDICVTLAESGADVIELGVPFSDPIADGPTIQRSSARALANGTSLRDVLKLSSEVKRRTDVPLVLFSYFNPVFKFGIENFVQAAADSGIDALLLTDVVDAEALTISEMLLTSGIDLISLIAPTTNEARIADICSTARGFIYAVSRAGVTGVGDNAAEQAQRLVERIRPHTVLPIAVGFGLSTSDQIKRVWEYADAAVVGSAIVSVIESSEPDNAVENVAEFVRGILPAVAKRTL
ncbi:MAG: tryptophan synthase subunit alpha [Chloracidobacterium sp.]|nr:tryptophan synthase subunit alpha [Chloracidobacterium sp.]MCO5334034.1 tryptophan synthase subunit alpha [Pyrinomonadaceae bacterium]